MLEKVLERQGDDALSTAVVWLPVEPGEALLTDTTVEEAMELLSNPRVTQHWNPDQDVGRWLKRHVLPDFDGEVVWDSYLLFGAEATWDDAPGPLAGTGFPVVATVDRLLAELGPLL